MGVVKEQFEKVLIHLKERGIKEAYNFAYYRYFFSVHNHFIAKLINIIAPYPPHIEVEITTKCNLRCLMCEHTYWNEPGKNMTFDQFVHIVDQFPKLKLIGITGIGESFLNKDFMKMVKYCKDRKQYVEVFDTFYFWDKDISYKMVAMGLNRVLPSFDATTENTYNKIRAKSNFTRVVKNIRDLFAAKEEAKKKLPEVCFHYIVSNENIDEMLLYMDLIRDVSGVQDVSIQFTEVLHGFKEIQDQLVKIPETLVEDCNKKASKLNIKLLWNRNVYRKKPDYSQCTLWTMPFIFVTGHVVPCCGGNEANRREFQKETSLGNILEQDFKTIWKGEKYKKLRKLLGQNKVPVQCEQCPAFCKK